MEDKDKDNVANGYDDSGTNVTQDTLPSSSAASMAGRLNRGKSAGERKVSGSRTPSQGTSSKLLAKIRDLHPTRAAEIRDALLGEGSAYVDTILQSSVALRRAVETADTILNPKPRDENEAGFTLVVRKQRGQKKRSNVARGSGSRGRGRGRGRRVGTSGGGLALAKANSKAKPAKSKQTPGTQPASEPTRPEARQPKASRPQENAWNRKLQVTEWGLMTEDEESSKSDDDGCTQPFMSEDNDDGALPFDPALESAMACTIRRRGGFVWGYVVRIRSRMATILWGENSTLRIRLPTRGANAKLKVGDAVGVVTRRTQHPDGQVTLSHTFASFPPGKAPRPTPAELPSVKAVVLSFEAFKDDGGENGAMVVEESEEESGVGEAVVPLTGFTGHFRAPHHDNADITAGCSFWFTPTFEGTVMVIGDLQKGCAITPPKSGKAGPPTTRADLAEGFLCPERQLQSVLKEKFSVDMMPFVGRTKTVFDYSMGADLARAFDTSKGKANSKQAMSLKDLEEVLVKAAHYRKSKAAAEANEVRQKLRSKQEELAAATAKASPRILWAEHRKATLEEKREAIATLEKELSEAADNTTKGRKQLDKLKVEQRELEGESVEDLGLAEAEVRKSTLETSREAVAVLENELSKAAEDNNKTQEELKKLEAELRSLEEGSLEGLQVAESVRDHVNALKGVITTLEAQAAGRSTKSNRELLEKINTQHKHFYVPTAQNAEAFAKWIKRDLGKAAASGERLQAVVGVFVDESCTLGSLYNTEDVPYANMKQCPWARSFTLVSSPVICYTLDKHGSFVPSESIRRGKRILLVELDSQFKSAGTLPRPSELKLHQPTLNSESIVQPTDLLSREFVLVSLAEDDPRFRMLMLHCGASIYKRKGKLVVLACPFATLEDAERYALGLAANPRGVFGMLKRDLYAPETLTLTCSGEKPVKAEELFYLVNAMGVLPIGGNRYRITTTMSLLEAAQVFHFQNEYVQGDNKKFISLRDDKNQFTMLNTKKPPRSLKSYYRLEPVQDLKQQPQSAIWYQVTNLPNGITASVLLRALKKTEWWPNEANEVLLDERPFQPEAWFKVKTAKTCEVPVSAVVANRPVAIVESDAPYELLQKSSPVSEAKDPMSILNFGERELDWRPGGKTKAVVDKRISGKKRAIKRKVPKRLSPAKLNAKQKAKQKVQPGLSGPQGPNFGAAQIQRPRSVKPVELVGKGQQDKLHEVEADTKSCEGKTGFRSVWEPDHKSGSSSGQADTMLDRDDSSDKGLVPDFHGQAATDSEDGADSGVSKAGAGRKRDREPPQKDPEDSEVDHFPQKASRGHFPQEATPKKPKPIGALDSFIFRLVDSMSTSQTS